MRDFNMKAIYHAGILFSLCTLCAQPVFAAENPLQNYSGAAQYGGSSMASGTPMQGGLPASARNGMNVVSQSTPGGYPVFDSSAPYREKQSTPTVMDAPPAWAQEGLAPSASALLAPFGANLFRGNFAGTYSDGMNGDYVILPGDRIMVRVWGAKTYDDVLPVDQQGNIFLPEVGPVRVAGLKQSALQGAVRSRLASVFTDNVNIYVNLQSSQPVAVYVTWIP